MNVVREIQRINDRELELNVPEQASWHAQYKHSAYVFVAGLDHQLTEGDVICILSQFGEVVDCNLVRDKETGKSRGFAFVAFEDQRSTVLAIDNLNGALVLNRTLRVDHADKYRRPKEANPSSSAPDADYLQFDGEQAPDYDQRRKAIWDYEAYGTAQGTSGGGEEGRGRREVVAGSAPTSYSVDVKALKVSETSEDKNALRILMLWEERQVKKKEREEEEKRKERQQKEGRDHGGKRRFGDQEVQSTAVKQEERKEERAESTSDGMKREERPESAGRGDKKRSGDEDRRGYRRSGRDSDSDRDDRERKRRRSHREDSDGEERRSGRRRRSPSADDRSRRSSRSRDRDRHRKDRDRDGSRERHRHRDRHR